MRRRRGVRGLLGGRAAPCALGAAFAACGYCAAPTRPPIERGAQRRRPRPGVGGVADRAHHHDPRSRRRRRPRPRSTRRCRRSRTTAPRAGRRRVAHVLQPGGRAARLGRGLPHGPHAELVGAAASPAASCSGEWVDSPTSRARPPGARPPRACRPGPRARRRPPRRRARSGRSLIQNSAPCSSQASGSARRRRAARRRRRRGRAAAACRRRPSSAARSEVRRRGRVGHEVEARGGQRSRRSDPCSPGESCAERPGYIL